MEACWTQHYTAQAAPFELSLCLANFRQWERYEGNSEGAPLTPAHQQVKHVAHDTN